MDALKLLQDDHEAVLSLFDAYQKLGDGLSAHKTALARKICREIELHSEIEERVLYPELGKRRSEELRDKVREGFEEHLSAKRIIGDLRQMNAQDPQFDAKVRVLNEELEHHIKEEEDEMFPEARDLMSEDQLEEIGDSMQALRESLEQGTAEVRPDEAASQASV
ncbi:MAG TPA: hemerythrin domain-containing protein [Myxococcota bacterium]|nr:hemerythrin domain-containing protein [Myxococcota bacterium]